MPPSGAYTATLVTDDGEVCVIGHAAQSPMTAEASAAVPAAQRMAKLLAEPAPARTAALHLDGTLPDQIGPAVADQQQRDGSATDEPAEADGGADADARLKQQATRPTEAEPRARSEAAPVPGLATSAPGLAAARASASGAIAVSMVAPRTSRQELAAIAPKAAGSPTIAPKPHIRACMDTCTCT